MIEFVGLEKSFGEKRVLDGVSFEVRPAEIVVVLGRSGTGKSVLLKHVVGLLRPDAGEVRVDGVSLAGLDEKGFLAIRKLCGMVFQLPALIDSLTVFDNVAFGVRVHRPGTPLAEIRKDVGEALEAVHLGESVWYRYPPELSFGMQKRVSLARSVLVRPKYLLFDEPTTGMDPVVTGAINRLIVDLTRRISAGAVVVSHDLPGALEIADRILLLDAGKVRFEGTAEEFRRTALPLARDFLSAAGVGGEA
jgi:phospholipid/cholesterol/gamma-HCH transport system ATP-binding protein